MNNRIGPETLDDVLDAFAARDDVPDSAQLAEWIRRYPQYEQELTDFAVAWTQMEHLPPAPHARGADTETLVLRGMSIFQNVRYSKAAAVQQPLEGIVAPAAQRGLSLDALADALRLNAALVRKLDRRLIAYRRLPLEIKDALAAVLGRPRHIVEEYLQQPGAFARGARHRADQTPSLAAQEDFFEAIRNDPDLDAENRQYWLSLERSAE